VARTVWEKLVVPHLGSRPVTAMIYTHSHVDHYGGVRGIVRQEDVDAGRVLVLAPAGFTDAAVSENVMAGNVMSRRATYMYGNLLAKGPQGQVDGGLGKTTSTGTVTLVVPTDFIERTGDKRTVDGVEMHFIYAPDSEAPVEVMWYMPRYKVFQAAEDVTHTFHNLYTLRGAKYRNGLKWSAYLQEALDLFGEEMEFLVNSHHWPTFGNAACREHIAKQRDLMRFTHDQTLRMANQGMTSREIGDAIRLPDSLDRYWPNRGYYGSLYHNARAQYGLYLGWFDGVPANLDPHTPVESGKRYVAAMGGAANVLKAGRDAFDQGDYRWAAELVNHLVFAEPSNREAKELVADAYEQMGYQAESGPWRNFYLTGTQELRQGVQRLPAPNTASPDTVRAMPMDLLLNYLGMRIDPAKAAGRTLTINLALSEPEQKFVLGVENSCLHWSAGRQARNADATVALSRASLNEIIEGARTLEQQVMAGKAQVTGNARAVGEFTSMLDTFEFWFNIVTP
jgi:alkyl sulfatase BDS1-like metallo-beta-lactamase superfamily hydrolase